MISYIFVSALILSMLVIQLSFLKQKIHSPSIIFLSGYLLSIIFAIIGLKTWNTEKALSAKTIILIAGTCASFSIGSLLAQIFKPRKKREKQNNTIINFPLLLYFIFIGIILATIILEYLDLKRICNAHTCTASSISDLIYYFRTVGTMFSDDGETMGFITEQMIKFSNIIILCSIYIFTNNLINKDRIKNNIKYLPLFILAIPLSLLQSGRSSLLVFLIGAIVIYIALKTKGKGDRRNTIKLIKKLAPIGALILVFFYFSASLVGREAKADFESYTTFYYGCTAPSLNYALRKGTNIKINPIDNSLWGIGNILTKLKLHENNEKISLPFIRLNGFSSNVYTSAYRLYLDFGYCGFLFTAFSGLVYGLLYKKMNDSKKMEHTLFYALFASKILDSARSEGFYSTFLSFRTVICLFFIIIICYIIRCFNERGKKETQ